MFRRRERTPFAYAAIDEGLGTAASSAEGVLLAALNRAGVCFDVNRRPADPGYRARAEGVGLLSPSASKVVYLSKFA